MPAPVFFAITQGVWFGLIGLAASLCVGPLLPFRYGLVLAILVASNGISLATIGFPHIEIAIPALILLILALWVAGRQWAACLLVPLLLTVREDAGLHLATILGLIAMYRWRTDGSWKAGRGEVVLAALCVTASLATLAVQEAFFVRGIDQMQGTYLGVPTLGHVNWRFLVHRILCLGQNRSYIYLPLLFTLFFAIRRRDLALALGPLSCVPWLALALIAVSPLAGELMSYYSFPLMVGLCWPMIAAQPGFGRTNSTFGMRLLAGNIAMSIILFGFSGGMHDRRPWQSFGLPNGKRVSATERALDQLLAHRDWLGHFLVDDAVGALRPSAFTSSELRILMNFPDAEVAMVDVLIFQPVAWLDARKREIITNAGLCVHYQIRGTSLRVYSRAKLLRFDFLDPLEPEEPRCHHRDLPRDSPELSGESEVSAPERTSSDLRPDGERNL